MENSLKENSLKKNGNSHQQAIWSIAYWGVGETDKIRQGDKRREESEASGKRMCE